MPWPNGSGCGSSSFSIGFGKRLVGFRKGETDYRINAIPLGGYVKMSGENPDGPAHRRSAGVHESLRAGIAS